MRGRITEPDLPVKRARIDEAQQDIKREESGFLQAQEQSLVRLVEERRSQIMRIEEQTRDLQAQLVEAQKNLTEAEALLARLRCHPSAKTPFADSNPCPIQSEHVKVKTEPDVNHSSNNEKSHLQNGPIKVKSEPDECGQGATSGPNVRAVNTPKSSPTVTIYSESKISGSSSGLPRTSAVTNVKSETWSSAESKSANKVPGSSKREHADLVLSVRGSKAPCYVNVLQPLYFASEHKRKLRSLAINPTSYQICVTSALDGLINVWQIRGKGEDLSLISSIDCRSPGQRRWPEDLAWHPSGESLFACYSADGKDNQVAIINSSGKAKVQFLEEKPHEKGIINSLVFMPSDVEPCFATGGCDHAVVLWKEDISGHWKPKILHKSLHSSAVMGVGGMQHKPLMLSVGLDKRVVGFNTQYCRQDFRHQLDSKALGMIPNPVDLNLFMVQTGFSGRQLRLFDVRMRGSELHAFGWRQESSECQSALISQSWSPDGFHIASGSTDPKVHIFDIRYNSNEPSQSVKAHQKRVFKAAWHHTLPLLISISSDLHVGLLKTIG